MLSGVAATSLLGAEFVATNYPYYYNNQNFLYLALTNTLQSSVDPSIDTLRFSSNKDDKLTFYRDTLGSIAPQQLSTLGENRAYQNLVFENTSTQNLWTLTGGSTQSVCNPCTAEEYIVSTKSLTLTTTSLTFATTLAPDENPASTVTDKIGLMYFENPGGIANINLNNGYLLLENKENTGRVEFRSDAAINITGNDNILQGTSGSFAPSSHELFLNIDDNSSLIVIGSTELLAYEKGHVSVKPGGTLIVQDSKLHLVNSSTDSKYNSTFDNATLRIGGDFGLNGAEVIVSRPTFTDSEIYLENDTSLKSAGNQAGVFTAQSFSFIGNNKIFLGTNAKMTGFTGNIVAQTTSDTPTEAIFSNGVSTIDGEGSIDLLSLSLNNASLTYSGANNISGYQLEFLYLENGSTLTTNLAQGDRLNELKTLSVKDSSLVGMNSYGSRLSVLKAEIENSIIKNHYAQRTGAISFFSAGADTLPSGFGDGSVTFSGKNTFVSRIDPFGKEIIPTINTYADALYFTRVRLLSADDYTADTVLGFSNLGVELEAFAPGLSATDYVNGGENSDGVYEIMVFNSDGDYPTSAASADSDDVTITLGASMPAVLQATQITTPSVENNISIKLEAQSISTLAQHPNIVTTNQQNSSNLLINSANNGNTTTANALNTVTNAQLQSQMDTISPETYASYMTVSLEHTDMLMNSVLNNTSLNMTSTAKQQVVQDAKNFWMDASYSKGDVDGSLQTAGFKYILSSIVIGDDIISNDYLSTGFFVSLGKQEMSEHKAIEQNFNGTEYYVGAYFNQKFTDDWSLGSILGFGYGEHQSDRQVFLANSTEQMSAKFNTQSFYAGLKLSKPMYKNSWVDITPEAGFDYTYYQQEKVNESGDQTLSLIVDAADAQFIIASVGINAQFQSISQNNKVYPIAFMRYEQDFYANKIALIK